MYKLRCVIKCPDRIKPQVLTTLEKLQILNYEVKEVTYADFIEQSRMYWDYVFPEMRDDRKPVTYISFDFPDTPEGREKCHKAETSIGWIPLNIRYVEE